MTYTLLSYRNQQRTARRCRTASTRTHGWN